MATDLTKLAFDSRYPAFINKTVYTGSVALAGSTSSGTNLQTFTIPLNAAPDLVDIMFSDSLTSGWSKVKTVTVPTNNAGGGNPSQWVISSRVSGSDVIIEARYVQTFPDVETLTSTPVYYRIVDYSIFD